MQRLIATVTLVGLGLGWLAACGGSSTVDFYDANAGGGAGRSVVASAGSTSAGSAGQASAGSNSGPSDLPCSPFKETADKMSGPFNTTGAVCLRVTDDIAGWGCSNFEGRSVKVNGVAVTCAQVPLPDTVHGDYYFDISSGEYDYASLYWF